MYLLAKRIKNELVLIDTEKIAHYWDERIEGKQPVEALWLSKINKYSSIDLKQIYKAGLQIR